MRLTHLLSIIVLCSCENKKAAIANRQEAVQQEMEQIKTAYYKTSDSLENIKRSDTSAAMQVQVADELVSAERSKNARLIPLQLEYDSLATALQQP